jgi:hypothetical protein
MPVLKIQWNQWVAMSFLRFDDPCVINFDGVFEGAVGAGCALPGAAFAIIGRALGLNAGRVRAPVGCRGKVRSCQARLFRR